MDPFHRTFKNCLSVQLAEKLGRHRFSIKDNARYKGPKGIFETRIEAKHNFELCARLTFDVTFRSTIFFIHVWFEFFEGGSGFCIDNRGLELVDLRHVQVHRM